uniref:Uncharacterized protein n=1 Tax=Rhizochromulina marina TaxID=1034831 RepID=A0A7S2RHY2_9STRA
MWFPLTDKHLEPITERSSREFTRSLKTLISFYDNLTDEHIQQVMYDAKIVRNLEWVIKLSVRCNALSDGPRIRRKTSRRNTSFESDPGAPAEDEPGTAGPSPRSGSRSRKSLKPRSGKASSSIPFSDGGGEEPAN